jgi:hypothetical protein
MRSLLAILAVAATCGAGPAHAEKRLFIVGNSPDGYGIDRCLASGAACGKAAAHAYCRSRQFTQARSFRKVDRSEITGAVPTSASGGCSGGACADFVAIECTR